jgi:hypothetical protein
VQPELSALLKLREERPDDLSGLDKGLVVVWGGKVRERGVSM